MPMSMTHNYIAKDIFAELDKGVQGKLKANYHDYLVYANGFDVLFFGIDIKNPKKSREVIKLGNYAQNVKTNEFLINITEKVKVSQNLKEFAYLCGLITHYVADSTIHPFINYKASCLTSKENLSDAHFNVESYLDNYLIRKREPSDYRKFKVYKALDLKLDKSCYLEDFLEKSFQEVFKIAKIGKYYYKSLFYMDKFFHYLRDDSLGLKHIFYLSVNFLSKRIFKDVSYLSYHFKLDNDNFMLNLEHDEWYNIQDKTLVSSDSFLDLYAKVIKKGTKMIETVADYIFLDKKVDLEKLYENKSYSNGIVIK